MRLYAVAALSFALTASVYAQSGKTWDRTYPVNGRVELEVTTGEASIHTTGCGTCKAVTIHVDAQGQDLAEYKLEESSSGNRVTFSLKRRDGNSWGWSHGRSPEVNIQTPTASDVTLKSGSGATELAGVNGNLHVSAGSGGVHITESAGHLVGAVGSGGFTADGGFSQFSVRSGSGGVNVRLRPGQQIDGDSSVAAGSGGVHLAVPRDLHVSLQATAGSGSIHSDIPLLTTGEITNRHAIHGTLNGGGPQLLISTGSGSTTINTL